MTLWTVAHQAPLSMGFLKQEYWSGLSFPSPEDLLNPGMEPTFPALTDGFFTTEPPTLNYSCLHVKDGESLIKASYRYSQVFPDIFFHKGVSHYNWIAKSKADQLFFIWNKGMNNSGLQLTKEKQYFIPGSSDVKKLKVSSTGQEYTPVS